MTFRIASKSGTPTAAQRLSSIIKSCRDYPTWRQVTDALREASQHAPIPVTPNCALTGRCVANLEPHITCDGWMTPCYLSDHKLFSVLDTSADQISAYLMKTRPQFLDVCGRAAWTRDRRVSA